MAEDDTAATFVPTMKKAAAALRDAGVPYALTGGLAAWARGGPDTSHDIDFVVKPEDAERAQTALVEAGMRPERPPEGWLLKVYDGDILVDLISEPNGGPVDDGWLERADEREVMAMAMPLASLEDIMVSKLLSISEEDLDFSSVLEVARPLRAQLEDP